MRPRFLPRLRKLLRDLVGAESSPTFDAVLREALDEPLLLLSPDALERSLERPFHPQPQ